MSGYPDDAQAERPSTPEQAWRRLCQGNERFRTGVVEHPNQDVHVRHEISAKQRPFAVFFGCADSRVAAELIFDQGLGDLFVVRTAGHVVDSSVLGSIEFGVTMLGSPLIVVLGHDSCGAVRAAHAAATTGVMPSGFLRDVVERVMPSVLSANRSGSASVDSIEREHVLHTCELLTERSQALATAVAEGRLAVVGAEYDLESGHARLVGVIGDVGVSPHAAMGS